MRYASIETFDICNGENVGMSLFVQGCHFWCPGCFNKEAWDFNGGKGWTEEVESKFLELVDRPYIKRVSILGGEPLAKENCKEVSNLIWKIRNKFGDSKKIWLYTGYDWNEITMEFGEIVDNHNQQRFERHVIVEKCDVLVDGKFEEEKKDLSLKFRGSANQRIIDVKESLKEGKVILWTN